MGDLLTEDVLRRPRTRPGRAGDDVDARSRRRCSTPWCRRRTGRRLPAAGAEYTQAFYADPVRRYMLPVFSDRRTDWPSHPHATRDSLHEHDMWVAEGLTHRYPTKVLAELLPTCPQYCGHCTRMDLVGNSTPQVAKLKLDRQAGRPVCGDARLPAAHAAGPRRRRLRRRRGQHAVEEPRGVPRPAARDRQHPRHPAGHQGPDGAAAALAGSPTSSRAWAGSRPRPAARGVSLAIHTHVNNAAVGDAGGGGGGAGDAGRRRPRRPQPGRPHARRQRLARAAARPVLRALRRRLDHAVLLLHVRHDPVRRALAGLAGARPRSCSTRSWATCRGSPRRGSSATSRSSGSGGSTRSTSYDTERGISYWRKNYRTSIEGGDEDGAVARLRLLRPDRHAAARPDRTGGARSPTSARSTRSRRRGPSPAASWPSRRPADRASAARPGYGRTMPETQRREVPRLVGDELTTAVSFLDFQREASPPDVRGTDRRHSCGGSGCRPGPTCWACSSHLVDSELWWFHHHVYGDAWDGDFDMNVPLSVTADEVTRAYPGRRWRAATRSSGGSATRTRSRPFRSTSSGCRCGGSSVT